MKAFRLGGVLQELLTHALSGHRSAMESVFCTLLSIMGVRLELLTESLEIAADNYKDNIRILTGLDDKAQKMGALAGLFLAVPFAFARPDAVTQLRNMVGVPGMLMLAATIILFMSCIGLCLTVMWVRSALPPLDLTSMKALTGDLLQTAGSQLDEDVRERFCNDRIHIWERCLATQERIARRKWKLLFAAQMLLGAAILPIGVLLLRIIYSALLFVRPLAVPVISSSLEECWARIWIAA